MQPASSSSCAVVVCMSFHRDVNMVNRDWSVSGLTNCTWMGHAVGRIPDRPEPIQAPGLKMFVGILRNGKNCRAKLMNMVMDSAVRQFHGRIHIFGN